MSVMKKFKSKNTFPIWGILAVLMVFSCQDLNLEDRKMEDLSKLDQAMSNVVPGRYIVTLHSNTINFRLSDKYEDVQAGMRKIASDILIRYEVSPEKIQAVYGHAITGFTLELTAKEYQLLSQDDQIKSIEPDSYISESYNQRKTPPGQDKPKEEDGGGGDSGDSGTEPSDPDPSEPNPGGTIQNDAPKYLDRIDQRSLPLNGIYSYNETASGVAAYIPYGLIWTDFEHELPKVRISNINLTKEEKEENGSSTNTAIVVGGINYGPAKGIQLVGIKAFESSFEGDQGEAISNIIKVYDEILAKGKKPAVVITSIMRDNPGTAYFSALKNLYDAGYPLFVSSGAWMEDACTWASSFSPYVFTVGMARIDDTKTTYSNYGTCIDLFATSTDWGHEQDGYNEEWMPGFGMNPNFVAVGLAAGVAAKFLERNPNASPDEVYQFLRNTATKNVVKLSNSVNNHLLFSGMTMDGAGNIDPSRINHVMDLLGSSRKLPRNIHQVILEWNPITNPSGEVDVYENGKRIAKAYNGDSWNGGNWFYDVSGKNLSPRTYKICLSGTNKCSNEVVINFN